MVKKKRELARVSRTAICEPASLDLDCVRLTSCSLVSRPVYGSGLGSAPSPRLLLLRAHCETTRGPGTSWPVLEHGVRCEPPHALIGKMELSSAHPDLPTLASLEYSVDTQRHKKTVQAISSNIMKSVQLFIFTQFLNILYI